MSENAFSKIMRGLEEAKAYMAHHEDNALAEDLGALGYPGFAYLHGPARNPAEVLIDALDRPDLAARVAEALPWLPLTFPSLDWPQAITALARSNRQNRLGFVVGLSHGLALRQGRAEVADTLAQVLGLLEEVRLLDSDTLATESMPLAFRRSDRARRSMLAEHWNLDTSLTVDQLIHCQ